MLVGQASNSVVSTTLSHEVTGSMDLGASGLDRHDNKNSELNIFDDAKWSRCQERVLSVSEQLACHQTQIIVNGTLVLAHVHAPRLRR